MEKMYRFFKKTSVKVAGLSVFLLFLVSIFLCFGWYQTQFNKGISYYWVYKGDKAYKKADLQKAIELYTTALELNPTHTKARYNLANILVVYEDYQGAADEYEKVLIKKPNFMVARIDYGIILAETLLNYDHAIQQYQRAINLRPPSLFIPFIINNAKTIEYNTGVANYNMGLAYRGKSMLVGERTFASKYYLEQAKECYERAILFMKNDYDALYNYALSNQLLGNYKEAGLGYCKAISASPLNYEAHYNLAILLRGLKKYPYALEEFRKAGLILDVKGDYNKTRHVYMMLNEVNQKLVARGEYKYLLPDYVADDNDEYKELTQNQNSDRVITYDKNGHVALDDDFEKSFRKNMKECNSRKFFEKI